MLSLELINKKLDALSQDHAVLLSGIHGLEGRIDAIGNYLGKKIEDLEVACGLLAISVPKSKKRKAKR